MKKGWEDGVKAIGRSKGGWDLLLLGDDDDDVDGRVFE